MNKIEIKDGGVISKVYSDQLKSNYKNAYQSIDQTEYEQFSIGVLKYLAHDEGAFVRIHYGRRNNENCLILMTVDENGEILKKQFSNKFIFNGDYKPDEKADMINETTDNVEMIVEFGRKCPPYCKP